jgi:hypothetical protein
MSVHITAHKSPKRSGTMVNQRSMLNNAELDGVSGGQTYPILGDFAGADVQVMCFIVMMEATKCARDDLKAIMGGIPHPGRHTRTR